jgi:hypothetical protein
MGNRFNPFFPQGGTMKKLVILVFALSLVASGALALGLPGGGGKVDTKKIDEALTAVKDVADRFSVAKTKVEKCNTSLKAVCDKYGIADVLADPAGAAALKDKLTAEDKEALKVDFQALATVATDVNTIISEAPTVSTKVAAGLVDVVNQIKANPLSAGDLNKKKDELNAAKTTIETITTEAPALIEAATKLSATVGGML